MTDSVFERRPTSEEYHEWYSAYVGLVPDGNVLDALRSQRESTMDVLASAPESRAEYRYEPGKWSLKEVVRHLVDTEWIFTNRALRFARGDAQPLPGMDQNDFVAGIAPDLYTLGEVADELQCLRSANLRMFRAFDGNALGRAGEASECQFTVRSILWIIAGHELHHLNVIRDRYLS